MTAEKTDTARLVEHHERQCNRYVNGFCQTRACLRRGGWQGRPDDEVPPFPDERATCLAHETALTLRAIPAQGDIRDRAAKIADPWSPAGPPETDVDKAVVEVRTKIAASIRALTIPAQEHRDVFDLLEAGC